MSKRMSETAMLGEVAQSIKAATNTRPALQMKLTEIASTANNLSAEEMLARAEGGGLNGSTPPPLSGTENTQKPILVDPAKIRPSRFANRLKDNFSGPKFQAFKDEIAAAGVNTVPIKLRNLPSRIDGYEYEVVYGHRRHAACFQLKCQVAAFVESMDDETLFIEMERENRGREDLSAWEQGVSYARALDDGLFASARKLSEKIGIDVGQIGKAVSLAKLPKEVVEAFSSPLDLQYRFAKPLKDALDKSPDDVLSRAQAIKQAGEKLSGKEVLSRLINGMQPEGEAASNKVKKVSLKGKGGQLGGIQFNRDMRSAVITVKNVDPTRFAEVQQLVADFLNKS